MTHEEATTKAQQQGPQYKAARGATGAWYVINTAEALWHQLSDFELASVGLRRSDLAKVEG